MSRSMRLTFICVFAAVCIYCIIVAIVVFGQRDAEIRATPTLQAPWNYYETPIRKATKCLQ